MSCSHPTFLTHLTNFKYLFIRLLLFSDPKLTTAPALLLELERHRPVGHLLPLSSHNNDPTTNNLLDHTEGGLTEAQFRQKLNEDICGSQVRANIHMQLSMDGWI